MHARQIKVRDDREEYHIYYPVPCTQMPDGRVLPIYFNKLDFKDEAQTKTTKISPEILNRITLFLSSLLHVFRTTSIIGIERQLAVNYKATRVYQHVLTFFSLHIPYFSTPCILLDIYSQLKSQMFPALKGMSGVQLKSQSVKEAMELVRQRGDQESLNVLSYHLGKTKTKADDLADTILQMESLFRLWSRKNSAF